MQIGKLDLPVAISITPQTVLTSSSIALAFEFPSEGGFRHLPVVDPDEKVVGVVSVRTILNFLAQAIVSELSP